MTEFNRPLHLFATLVLVAASTNIAAAEIQVKQTDHGAAVTIDGAPFAEYRTRSGHQPVIWPIIGPGGQAMTRSYPVGPRLEGEPDDHPHHRSLWFNHGLVNGVDFWREPQTSGDDASSHPLPGGQIIHREFIELKNGDTASIASRNDWTSDGEKVCEDERRIMFGADRHGRWIDFVVMLHASEDDLELGDTKEGSFGLRVPASMAVAAGKGGKIVNSEGQRDAVAWGQSARWVDYSGPVEGRPAGIAIFSMPDSLRHPPRWHARDYGLVAANPFGEHEFVEDGPKPETPLQGAVKLPKGEKLRFHYRVLLHRGDLSPADLSRLYEQYANAQQESK